MLKLLGCTVIGCASTPEKIQLLESIGVHAFNYKMEKPLDALLRLAPNGLDIYFDNVGYGHIIEDAKKFSPYFGQDVVNDLLGNPPSRFGRKEDKRLNFNAQRDLVIKFKQSYCKYDVVGEEKKKGGD